MSKFYGFGTVFPGIAPVAPPVGRDAAMAPPAAFPAPPTATPSPAAGFAPFRYPVEAIGAPVVKGVVPGIFDVQTRASFVRGALMAQANVASTAPAPRTLLPPPAPVNPIFRTELSRKVAEAARSDIRAAQAARVATIQQKRADDVIFQARKAIEKATFDPSPRAQAEAESMNLHAKIAQDNADAAAQQADLHDTKATDDAAKAQQAADAARIAQATKEAAEAAAIAAAWAQEHPSTGGGGDVPLVAWDQRDPGEAIPVDVPQPDGTVVTIPMMVKKPPYMAAAAGAGVVGFFLGGPIGALIGAAVGAGGAYLTGKKVPSGQMVAVPRPVMPVAPWSPEEVAAYEAKQRAESQAALEKQIAEGNVRINGWRY
jgi:hypothetical protein